MLKSTQTQIKPIPVILDGDPGADDALAILLALRLPQLCVLGITTVCGNGPVQVTGLNASKICRLANRNDVCIYAGANQPLKRALEFNMLYCGDDGLCNTGLDAAPEQISAIPAWEYLSQTLCGAKEPVTIISTGCMTNIALALERTPQVASNIAQIITVSGYFGFNKMAARAEWNLMIDPEAAQQIYASNVRIRAIGLDVTSALKDHYVEELLGVKDGSHVLNFLRACDRYHCKSGLTRACLLNDAMAVAAAAVPQIASSRQGTVRIDCTGRNPLYMEFLDNEYGSVLAAERFDFVTYLKILEEYVI